MKNRQRMTLLMAVAAIILSAFASTATPSFADTSTSITAIGAKATFAGFVYNGCQSDGAGNCTTSAVSTACVVVGVGANPLGVLDCSYTFSFAFPRGCGPAVSSGNGTLAFQGQSVLQNLIVTIHGTTFEAEGVYEFPGTNGLVHTTITGKHQCGYTNGTQGAFTGSSEYLER